MVEDYKGEITLKSEQGKGTCFTISLPSNVKQPQPELVAHQ